MIEEDEVNILILSDRGVNKEFAPIPALLAVVGPASPPDPRGPAHAGVASCSRPAKRARCITSRCSSATAAQRDQSVPRVRDARRHDPRRACCRTSTTRLACKNFVEGRVKGVVKVMSKMGISTVQSYRGAQMFEAVGLRQDVIDEYFTWTASRVGGVGLDVIAQEVLMRHTRAFPERQRRTDTRCRRAASTSGARTASIHLFNPESIHRLQKAVRNGNLRDVQGILASSIDEQREEPLHAARPARVQAGRSRFRSTKSSPVESIVKRFKTGAMSYGSISKEAHETLAIAMNRIGGKSNTGEGGEDPERYVPMPNGDSKNSRDQAGRLGPLRRHQPLPGQREGTADQDGAGREARRRRPAARHQGVSVDRQDAAHHAGRRPHLAAAASRHLFDRRPRRADPRSEEREPRRAHQREAGGRSRRRHDRRRRGQGARGRRAHQRPRRRHRRFAADVASSTPACRGSSASPRRTRRWCSTTCAAASPSRPTAS